MMIRNTTKIIGGVRRCATRATIIGSRRQFNFASSRYASAFDKIPTPDVDKLRKDAVAYLDSFDKQSWYDDPVRTYQTVVSIFGFVFYIYTSHTKQYHGNMHRYAPS